MSASRLVRSARGCIQHPRVRQGENGLASFLLLELKNASSQYAHGVHITSVLQRFQLITEQGGDLDVRGSSSAPVPSSVRDVLTMNPSTTLWIFRRISSSCSESVYMRFTSVAFWRIDAKRRFRLRAGSESEGSRFATAASISLSTLVA
jgi:hypothetical protein